MEMPVIIGVIIAAMFLITFTGWFVSLAAGLKEFVLDDVYFYYRIFGAGLVSTLVMVGAFFAIATIKECPNQIREGLFAGLKCDSYLKLRASADNFLKPAQTAENNISQ